MATQLRPLTAENLSIPRANVLIGAVGSNKLEDAGDCEAFSLSIEVQEAERYGKNFGLKTLRRSDVIQVDASVSMELVDMTKFLRALSVGGSDQGRVSQTAVTAATHTIQNVEAGRIYKLPHRAISNFSIDDGEAAPVAFVEGVDYVLLQESGYVQIVKLPDGAGPNAEILYDAAQIDAVDEKLLVGIGSDQNIRRQIHVIGINKVGPRDVLVLHDVKIRADGDRGFIGGDDYATITLTGRVYADPSQEPGFELGYLSEI